MTAIQSTYSWLTWGVMEVPNGGLSPEQLAALAAERERASTLPVIVSALPIGWRYDSHLRRRSAGDGVRLRNSWRRVTSFIVSGREVYLEAFGGWGSGPGFAIAEVRAYVDGRLTGRAWRGGCSLGFGGGVGPAVAMVSDTLAVIVPAPDVDQTTWESIALVGFADDGWVQEFLAGLPPPVGLNSRGRRAIRRWPLSFGSSPRVPSR